MISTAAYAADLAQPYQPVAVPQPVGAWYLRGQIGLAVINQPSLLYIQNPANSSDFSIANSSIGDGVIFGAGVGYEFNNWLRFDVTGEYRSKAPVNAFGFYTQGGGTYGDQYHGYLQSVVVLANAYIDLGTWNCLTPFVGVGVGGAWNQFANWTDTSIATASGGAGGGVGNNSSNFNLAWAIHAGVSYAVTQNFSVELAYRYLNYGSVTDSINCFGGCNPDSYKLQNLSSNDFLLGMRWRFPVETPLLAVPPPPISTRG
jgi:opacity protein-like surface antigen